MPFPAMAGSGRPINRYSRVPAGERRGFDEEARPRIGFAAVRSRRPGCRRDQVLGGVSVAREGSHRATRQPGRGNHDCSPDAHPGGLVRHRGMPLALRLFIARHPPGSRRRARKERPAALLHLSVQSTGAVDHRTGVRDGGVKWKSSRAVEVTVEMIADARDAPCSFRTCRARSTGRLVGPFERRRGPPAAAREVPKERPRVPDAHHRADRGRAVRAGAAGRGAALPDVAVRQRVAA